MRWQEVTLALSTTMCLLAAGFAVSGCKPATTSGIKDSAPGGQESDVTGGGPGGGEVGASQGAADSQFSSDDYLKPTGQPFDWTDDMTQSVLSGLSPVCPGDSAPADGSSSGQVAFALDGACQLFSVDDARQEIANLGAMYSKQGANLVDIMNDEATSQDLQTVDAAVPAIDLGSIVNQQDATSLALLGPTNHPKVAFALDDTGGGQGWVGGGKNYTAGSSQFSAIATAYFYVRNQNGLGLHSAVDITGKAFSIQRSVVYAKLEGTALTTANPPSCVNLQVQAFGFDVYKKTLQDQELVGANVSLASLSQTSGGTLNFSIGPIPFDVSWSFLLTGGVNASYSVHATAVEGEIDPNASATIGLEGGPDIKVAKAGVGGQLTIVNASLKGDTTVAVSTDSSGQPAICYNAGINLDLNNILGGSLDAYAQIGNPDKKVFNIPLGWRGEMKFVNWTGTSHTLPVANSGNQCLALIR